MFQSVKIVREKRLQFKVCVIDEITRHFFRTYNLFSCHGDWLLCSSCLSSDLPLNTPVSVRGLGVI